jgi:hypothetical protein
VDDLGALIARAAVFLICVLVSGPAALAETSRLAPLGVSKFIIFDGDSVVTGYPGNSTRLGRNLTFPDGTDFPSVVLKELGSSWVGFNVAQGARPLAATPGDNIDPNFNQIGDFNGFVAPRIQQARAAGATHIIVINGGEPGDLLYYCSLNHGAGGEAAQEAAYQALKTYAAKVHEAGALFIDITMPARVTDPAAVDKNLKTDIDAVNLRVREHCKADHICDAVFDLALDPRMKDPSNTEYYEADGTHFTTAGYRIWAEYVLKSIKQLIPAQ